MHDQYKSQARAKKGKFSCIIRNLNLAGQLLNTWNIQQKYVLLIVPPFYFAHYSNYNTRIFYVYTRKFFHIYLMLLVHRYWYIPTYLAHSSYIPTQSLVGPPKVSLFWKISVISFRFSEEQEWNRAIKVCKICKMWKTSHHHLLRSMSKSFFNPGLWTFTTTLSPLCRIALWT